MIKAQRDMGIRFLCGIFLFVFVSKASGQKLIIDTSAYGKWPTIYSPKITADGKFVVYLIGNTGGAGPELVMKATAGDWSSEEFSVSSVALTDDGNYCVYLKKGDSLGIQRLGSSSREYVGAVKSFKLSTTGSRQWLAYQLAEVLVVRGLDRANGNLYYQFPGTSWYDFDQGGDLILGERLAGYKLKIIPVTDSGMGTGKVIYSADNTPGILGAATDDHGEHFAFIIKDSAGSQRPAQLWCYQQGDVNARPASINSVLGNPFSLEVDRLIGFSRDGTRLFLNLREVDSKKKRYNVPLNVWSTADLKLQSQQLKELSPGSFLFSYSMKERKFVRVQQEDDERIHLPEAEKGKNSSTDFALVTEIKCGDEEQYWTREKPASYLVSTADGTRTRLPEAFGSISKCGRYVIYYSRERKNYFCYDIRAKQRRCITCGIQASWAVYGIEEPHSADIVYPVVGWLQNDSALLLPDQNDIWLIDPQGARKPVNVTDYYGRKHNISFFLGCDYSHSNLNTNCDLLLGAFNRGNKKNGFYRVRLGTQEEPKMLTMDDCIYNVPNADVGASIFYPIPGGHGYLVRRMTAHEFPNLYYTADFNDYMPLSDLHPDRKYNWYGTELISWTGKGGTVYQGVLYKPENFDPRRKYPLIFLYYERLSDQLNLYRVPDAASGRIDIPTFVSNGYLVFTPDIHYTTGEVGESALNSVLSAANYLSRFNWVDTSRMGIQGHSFGGYETDYIVTHTNVFKAACSAAGASDLVGLYGSIWYTGASLEGYVDNRGFRMGATLWQRPDLYSRNSPIFRADRVSTPVLLMNNAEDGGTPFGQGLEFFCALRRLGKTAWMLQYDGQKHTLAGEAAVDYTLRLLQFFGHYLKGDPAPVWMTKGISAKDKGFESGLEVP